LAGVWARGASEKIWDPLCISATVEASNFKFGTQIGFGTSLQKKRRLGPKLARGGGWGKDPLFISVTIKASDLKKLVHNMSSGLPCQTQALGRV